MSIKPMTFSRVGEKVVINSVEGGKHAKNKLYKMGILPGEEVLVYHSRKNMIIKVRESKIALGFGMASKVMVAEK